MCVIMLYMIKASVREIQHNLKAVLKYLDHGDEILITRRNKVIAKIIPESEFLEKEMPDFFGRAKTIFPETKGKTITGIITDDRRERF